MKYYVGDKVRIKSREWYEAKKDDRGEIELGIELMTEEMAEYAGREATIVRIDIRGDYELDIDKGKNSWSDWMFDDLLHHIDWEQRRYEIARDYYTSCVTYAELAVEKANDLIRELKRHLNDEEIQ